MAITSITGIVISEDCKTLIATFAGEPVPATYKNEITGVTFTSDTVGALTGTSSWTWTVTSADAGELFNGVITISALNGSDVIIEKYSVGTCELDCCIAGLLDAALLCTCKCNKCDEDLMTAQKVRLLADSAKYSAINNNVTDAINKYTKAKSFCTADCGCGC